METGKQLESDKNSVESSTGNKEQVENNTQHDNDKNDRVTEKKDKEDFEFSDSDGDSKNEENVKAEESDDEETKEKKKEEALKNELFSTLPKHCMAFVPPDIASKRRERRPTSYTTPEECFKSCPRIVPRAEWGADEPKKQAEQMMYRVRPAIFLETDASNCEDKRDCCKVLRTMQRLQMDLLNFDDIPFSFLISEDGTIYEGRGWGYENEKGTGFAGIGYIGYYSVEPLEGPTDAMLKATYDLIMCGVTKGFLYNPFSTGAYSGETPTELIKELMKHEEDIDYRTRTEDLGIDEDD